MIDLAIGFPRLDVGEAVLGSGRVLARVRLFVGVGVEQKIVCGYGVVEQRLRLGHFHFSRSSSVGFLGVS
ncbi:hypothetical protein [Salipiger mucosus]|uniref:hypothetical protein n=1 Tax=Salipiger mucosus TaxID=263378 RepID=UPI0018DD0D28|nr:hypothetical protein [Salipiger mucosus]